eukprot:GHVQ01015842.1.p1 GENE.GHVQ01015842.1~~GHVQ01015842.1.p1  ORF type:complete len:1972 (-),score=227.37 GHVQ01015842.1:1569-7484(-)
MRSIQMPHPSPFVSGGSKQTWNVSSFSSYPSEIFQLLPEEGEAVLKPAVLPPSSQSFNILPISQLGFNQSQSSPCLGAPFSIAPSVSTKNRNEVRSSSKVPGVRRSEEVSCGRIASLCFDHGYVADGSDCFLEEPNHGQPHSVGLQPVLFGVAGGLYCDTVNNSQDKVPRDHSDILFKCFFEEEADKSELSGNSTQRDRQPGDPKQADEDVFGILERPSSSGSRGRSSKTSTASGVTSEEFVLQKRCSRDMRGNASQWLNAGIIERNEERAACSGGRRPSKASDRKCYLPKSIWDHVDASPDEVSSMWVGGRHVRPSKKQSNGRKLTKRIWQWQKHRTWDTSLFDKLSGEQSPVNNVMASTVRQITTDGNISQDIPPDALDSLRAAMSEMTIDGISRRTVLSNSTQLYSLPNNSRNSDSRSSFRCELGPAPDWLMCCLLALQGLESRLFLPKATLQATGLLIPEEAAGGFSNSCDNPQQSSSSHGQQQIASYAADSITPPYSSGCRSFTALDTAEAGWAQSALDRPRPCTRDDSTRGDREPLRSDTFRTSVDNHRVVMYADSCPWLHPVSDMLDLEFVGDVIPCAATPRRHSLGSAQGRAGAAGDPVMSHVARLGSLVRRLLAFVEEFRDGTPPPVKSDVTSGHNGQQTHTTDETQRRRRRVQDHSPASRVPETISTVPWETEKKQIHTGLVLQEFARGLSDILEDYNRFVCFEIRHVADQAQSFSPLDLWHTMGQWSQDIELISSICRIEDCNNAPLSLLFPTLFPDGKSLTTSSMATSDNDRPSSSTCNENRPEQRPNIRGCKSFDLDLTRVHKTGPSLEEQDMENLYDMVVQGSAWCFPRGTQLLAYLFELCSSLQMSAIQRTKDVCDDERLGQHSATFSMQQTTLEKRHHQIALRLFRRAMEPYLEFLDNWVFRAEIVDPAAEFIVEEVGEDHDPLGSVDSMSTSLLTASLGNSLSDLPRSSPRGIPPPAHLSHIDKWCVPVPHFLQPVQKSICFTGVLLRILCYASRNYFYAASMAEHDTAATTDPLSPTEAPCWRFCWRQTARDQDTVRKHVFACSYKNLESFTSMFNVSDLDSFCVPRLLTFHPSGTSAATKPCRPRQTCPAVGGDVTDNVTGGSGSCLLQFTASFSDLPDLSAMYQQIGDDCHRRIEKTNTADRLMKEQCSSANWKKLKRHHVKRDSSAPSPGHSRAMMKKLPDIHRNPFKNMTIHQKRLLQKTLLTEQLEEQSKLAQETLKAERQLLLREQDNEERIEEEAVRSERQRLLKEHKRQIALLDYRAHAMEWRLRRVKLSYKRLPCLREQRVSIKHEIMRERPFRRRRSTGEFVGKLTYKQTATDNRPCSTECADEGRESKHIIQASCGDAMHPTSSQGMSTLMQEGPLQAAKGHGSDLSNAGRIQPDNRCDEGDMRESRCTDASFKTPRSSHGDESPDPPCLEDTLWKHTPHAIPAASDGIVLAGNSCSRTGELVEDSRTASNLVTEERTRVRDEKERVVEEAVDETVKSGDEKDYSEDKSSTCLRRLEFLEAPLFVAIQRCMMTPIRLQYELANRASVCMMMQQFCFAAHLGFIKQCVLFGAGDLMGQFIIKLLKQQWTSNVTTMTESVNSLFESQVARPLYQYSNVVEYRNRDWGKTMPRVEVVGHVIKPRTDMLQFRLTRRARGNTPQALIETLSLDYESPFPLSTVFDKRMLSDYTGLFRLIALFKYAEFNLGRIWLWFCSNDRPLSSVIGTRTPAGSAAGYQVSSAQPPPTCRDVSMNVESNDRIQVVPPIEPPELLKQHSQFEHAMRKARNLRREMLFVFSALHDHIMHEAIEGTWQQHCREMDNAVSLVDIIDRHRECLTAIHRRCLLKERFRFLYIPIIRILSHINAFRTMLEAIPRAGTEAQPTGRNDAPTGMHATTRVLESNTAARIYHGFYENRKTLCAVLRKLRSSEIFRTLCLKLEYNSFYSRFDQGPGPSLERGQDVSTA